MSGEGERLLAALQHCRGDLGSDTRSIAGLALIDGVVRRSFEKRRCRRDDWIEDAVSHAKEQGLLGKFSGNSPGEAVRWVQRVAFNAYQDCVRGERTVQDDGADLQWSDEPAALDRALGRERLIALERMEARLLLHAHRHHPKRLKAIGHFLDDRLGRRDPPGPTDGTPWTAAEERPRNRYYNDIRNGRGYASDAIAALSLDEVEAELAAWLLSGSHARARPKEEP